MFASRTALLWQTTWLFATISEPIIQTPAYTVDLKKRLAIDFADDVDGYVEAKTSFLIDILKRQGFSHDLLNEIEHANRRSAGAG